MSVPVLRGAWASTGTPGGVPAPMNGEQFVVELEEVAVQVVALRVVQGSQGDLCAEGRNRTEQGRVQLVQVVQLSPPHTHRVDIQ